MGMAIRWATGNDLQPEKAMIMVNSMRIKSLETSGLVGDRIREITDAEIKKAETEAAAELARELNSLRRVFADRWEKLRAWARVDD